MDLNFLWFLLLGVLLAGYAVLDGFDLGVGILHPLARTDEERRIAISSIGPIWDGNEVWLVTFGGALFAAFPEAYATIFEAFYTAFMLLLFCLIFRAVSLEFRSKVHSDAWRRMWDLAFFGSSIVATLLFGVAIGNGLAGIPLNERGEYAGTFLDLLKPYPLLVGRDDRRDVRRPRRPVPAPQDRRPPAAAVRALDLARLGPVPRAVDAHHDGHAAVHPRAPSPTSSTPPGPRASWCSTCWRSPTSPGRRSANAWGRRSSRRAR